MHFLFKHSTQILLLFLSNDDCAVQAIKYSLDLTRFNEKEKRSKIQQTFLIANRVIHKTME